MYSVLWLNAAYRPIALMARFTNLD